MSDGLVFDIQRSAMHDGPGIRTTVFLKGCPLRCLWCHNPESQACEAETVETEAGTKTYGRVMTVGEVMREVLKDRAYYGASGGGMTISGGEPTMQFAFCRELLEAARREGIHTCLDTSGQCGPEKLQELLPLVDVFLYDCKATGEALHKELTGVDGGLILRNLRMLIGGGARIVLRCPLVPGKNDTAEHFAALGSLSREFGGKLEIEVLPFHRAGKGKWAALGREDPCRDAAVPGEEVIARWKEKLGENGVLNWRVG